MNVAVIGTGYVGLPTGIGFAELGFNVVCIDKIKEKIQDLNNNKITLYEQGLEELFIKNKLSGRLKFTTDMSAVNDADVVIIAVGTPPHPVTNEADMKYIYAAASELSGYLNGYTVVAIKSTVPVGTGDKVESIISEQNPQADFDVVSLPEFLREGFAVHDFFNPDRIIIGSDSSRALAVLKELYSSFESKARILAVSRKSSETIKYASNSFLAVKIHYINEMADFCEKSGANIDEVACGMGLDSRIGEKFLKPGPGYGGSCFPKDTLAMSIMAERCGVKLNLINTSMKYNHERKLNMARRIIDNIKGIDNPVISILGLAFKGGTDDVRQSPAITILTELLKYDVTIRAYDPQAMKNAAEVLNNSGIYYASDMYDACSSSHLCVILTEWEQFKELDFNRLKTLMKRFNILDLRNLLDREKAEENGFSYSCIGYDHIL